MSICSFVSKKPISVEGQYSGTLAVNSWHLLLDRHPIFRMLDRHHSPACTWSSDRLNERASERVVERSSVQIVLSVSLVSFNSTRGSFSVDSDLIILSFCATRCIQCLVCGVCCSCFCHSRAVSLDNFAHLGFLPSFQNRSETEVRFDVCMVVLASPKHNETFWSSFMNGYNRTERFLDNSAACL